MLRCISSVGNSVGLLELLDGSLEALPSEINNVNVIILASNDVSVVQFVRSS